jgi:Enoyl-(Acyl carrier protein) reductase
VQVAAYNSSKAALNAYTVTIANDFKEARVNAISPGYVPTSLNSYRGVIPVEDSAAGVIKNAVLIDQTGPTCMFYFFIFFIYFFYLYIFVFCIYIFYFFFYFFIFITSYLLLITYYLLFAVIYVLIRPVLGLHGQDLGMVITDCIFVKLIYLIVAKLESKHAKFCIRNIFD